MGGIHMSVNQTKGEKIFGVINLFIMIIVMFITLYPLWYVFIASFSNPMDVTRGLVVLWPSGFELSSYIKVLNTPNIWTSYGNTIFYSVIGTATSIVLTVLGAYPLSKKRLRGRKFFMLLCLLTMWFNAGMLPTLLNFRNLGLADSRLGIILCYSVSTFYVILMRTFFENVPDSMEESAKIDGASDWSVLLNIYVPLSIPALATISLYYFVGRWNSYFWSMILLQDQGKVPLQVILRRLIVEVSNTATDSDFVPTELSEKTFIYATIVFSVVPMLMMYPYIQRFFVKGIMVGAIKG